MNKVGQPGSEFFFFDKRDVWSILRLDKLARAISLAGERMSKCLYEWVSFPMMKNRMTLNPKLKPPKTTTIPSASSH